MSKKSIRDDLNALLFNEIYLRFSEAKSKRKAFSILEAAIQCFARKGFDQVTLEMIAREAGVTRPLLKYYFKDAKDIETHALKYIRLHFQKLAVDALKSSGDPAQMLARYVAACMDWTQSFRTHVIVWFSFLHKCGRHSKSREMNTLAVQRGEERITSLVEQGIQMRIFRGDNAAELAKMVQIVITGAIFSSISEDRNDPKEFTQLIQKQALQVVGATLSV